MDARTANPAALVDQTFLIIFGVSAAMLALIVGLMIYFVIRYRRSRNPVAADIRGNVWLEVVWTAIPTLLVLGMFFYGWESFRALRTAPEGAMEVRAEARMWSWKFTYPNGRESNVLYVPTGAPVKLLLTSRDVIHGFYAPAFRVKIDTVPGMTTTAWLQADQAGDYDVFCSVYCGLQHAKMLSRVRAVAPEEFGRWLAEGEGGPTAPPEPPGKALLDRYGCLGCHSLDGSASAGPSLKGLLGRTVVLVGPDGRETSVVSDEAYLRRAVLGEKGGTVKGFDPIMPSFEGLIPAAEVDRMVDFLARPDAASLPDGRSVAEAEGCLGCHSEDGSILVGPSFKGMFGGSTAVLDHGHEHPHAVDREYVLDVLRNPARRPVKGFDPVMPAYPQLDGPRLEALLRYLESLGAGKEGR